MMRFSADYDGDTGEHRIHDNQEHGELIACVGNAAMDFDRQQSLADIIVWGLNRWCNMERRVARLRRPKG
jgi:hypothetical protein